MATIDNKQDFYRLYRKLQLGNTTRNFSWEDYVRSEFNGGVGVRNTIPGSPLMRYELDRPAALAYGQELMDRHGLRPDQLIVSELAPDNNLTLQAETLRTPKYLYARYSQIPGLRMRTAMENARHIEGLAAVELIRTHMDAPSWDFFNDVLDEYPDSVVEFTCYDRPVGVFRWNTLFWEVRNY